MPRTPGPSDRTGRATLPSPQTGPPFRSPQTGPPFRSPQTGPSFHRRRPGRPSIAADRAALPITADRAVLPSPEAGPSFHRRRPGRPSDRRRPAVHGWERGEPPRRGGTGGITQPQPTNPPPSTQDELAEIAGRHRRRPRIPPATSHGEAPTCRRKPRPLVPYRPGHPSDRRRPAVHGWERGEPPRRRGTGGITQPQPADSPPCMQDELQEVTGGSPQAARHRPPPAGNLIPPPRTRTLPPHQPRRAACRRRYAVHGWGRGDPQDPRAGGRGRGGAGPAPSGPWGSGYVVMSRLSEPGPGSLVRWLSERRSGQWIYRCSAGLTPATMIR
ncbi:hypothetical protein BJ981_004752 [Sphaerisporangium krabiense]|uniref:Uncharacterized protein n=1 Tax=Sphaerisporangium krabiense TaxID=763782 RepID=A0A7W8Z8I0_9ACTN|nr:hypothetical protein [Sphaerisporangium krabiense]